MAYSGDMAERDDGACDAYFSRPNRHQGQARASAGKSQCPCLPFDVATPHTHALPRPPQQLYTATIP
eukprot:scaffold16925_cov180-Isochrysis_galbana.AAC.1